MPNAFHSTVPVPAVNVPPDPLTLPPILSKLDPPFSVPLVLVHVPVKTCVKDVPRLRVPPLPLIVSPVPLILPSNVAMPPVFVIETVPVVVNPPMFCVRVVPVIVIAELPAVNVPAFIKSP